MDDSIFPCPDSKELKGTGIELEDREDIANYVGIYFINKKDGTIVMSQFQLIDQLNKDIKFKTSTHLLDTPTLSKTIL